MDTPTSSSSDGPRLVPYVLIPHLSVTKNTKKRPALSPPFASSSSLYKRPRQASTSPEPLNLVVSPNARHSDLDLDGTTAIPSSEDNHRHKSLLSSYSGVGMRDISESQSSREADGPSPPSRSLRPNTLSRPYVLVPPRPKMKLASKSASSLSASLGNQSEDTVRVSRTGKVIRPLRHRSPTISERGSPSSTSSSPPPLLSGRKGKARATSPVDRDTPASDKMSDVLQPSLVYEFQSDELSEDEDLAIDGETRSNDESDSDSDDDDIPVRLLHDFTIYELKTHAIVPLSTVAHRPSSTYSASGLVSPWANDDSDSDSDEESQDGGDSVQLKPEQRIKLSPILEFNAHFYSSSTKTLDSKMYIRTRFAWYILSLPAPKYIDLCQPFWIKHRLLYLIIQASLDDPRVTYHDFIDSLKDSDTDQDVVNTAQILGRELTEEDLEEPANNAYIISTLPEVCREAEISINRVPLVKSLLGSSIDYNETNTWPKTSMSSRRAPSAPSRKRHGLDDVTEHVQSRTSTVVTPAVARIANDLFRSSLEVTGSSTFDDVDEIVAAELKNVKSHHLDPKSMVWGKPMSDNPGFYRSVVVDGETYKIGDTVMVNPGFDEHHSRAWNAKSDAAQSINSFANRAWFCCIRYFFEEKDKKGKVEKKFHAQWFTHGSKTILQETAHSRALFFMNDCADNPIASIFRKCEVKMLSDDEREPVDDGRPDATDFHCGLLWDEEHSQFLNLPSPEHVNDILAGLPRHLPCYTCGIKEQENYDSEPRAIPGGFTLYGITYHRHDFVYVRPRRAGLQLGVAQIKKINDTSGNGDVSVQFFDSYDRYAAGQEIPASRSGSYLRFDNRRLVFKEKEMHVAMTDLDGPCYVRHLTEPREIEAWVKDEDHFYFNQAVLPASKQSKEEMSQLLTVKAKDFRFCELCLKERREKLARSKVLIQRNDRLRGLELFSGAGGLGTGFDLSGFVETKFAAEFSPSAAKTYQANHPNTVVYCQDTNLLLKHAIETHEGKHPKALKSNDGKSYCQAMPDKDEIDFIYGGPPCQSFSGANHNRKADDVRSTLPGNMLSFVEHYEPDYFLLENVRGLINHPLMSEQSERSLKGGIKSGMVKFIMRSLIALGYQVRYKLLQAGQYGAPQRRLRVIFWGAKRGIQLPDHPAPMYAFPGGTQFTKLPTGDVIPPLTRSKKPKDYHQYAPYKAVTVNDTLSDLPKFDWKNPHIVFAATSRDKQEVSRRVQDSIAQFAAVRHRGSDESGELPGFPEGVTYDAEPQNRYQRWLRAGMVGEDVEVEGHYTTLFKAEIVEATVTVPLLPLADHTNIPEALRPKYVLRRANEQHKPCYGRLDGDAHFRTAMTKMTPNSKNLYILHPSQKRILSVRECARAQGFPDHYVFKSADSGDLKKVDNQIRQIGNAVPVQLSLALGKALGEALLQRWAQKEREGSPVV